MSAADRETEKKALPLGWEGGKNDSPPYSSRDLKAVVWTRAEVDALEEVGVPQPITGGRRTLLPFNDGWYGQSGGYGNEDYELYTNSSTGAVVTSKAQVTALNALYERNPNVQKEAEARVKASQQIMGSSYLAGVVGLLLLGGIGFAIPNLAIGYIALMAVGGAAVFGVGGFLASKSIINKSLEAKLGAIEIASPEKQQPMHSSSLDASQRTSLSADARKNSTSELSVGKAAAPAEKSLDEQRPSSSSF